MGIVGYTIWGALILVGLCVLCTVLFSTRGIFYGKVDKVSVGIMAVPLVLLVLLGFVMETWVVAGIWTMLIMFALALLALLASGTYRLFV